MDKAAIQREVANMQANKAKKKSSPARNALFLVRVVVVYLVVSILIPALNFLAVSPSVSDWSQYTVFTEMSNYVTRLRADGLGPNSAPGMNAIAYIIYISLILLIILALISILDGLIKRIAVIGMTVLFFVCGGAATLTIVGSYMSTKMYHLPYAYVAAALYFIAGIACIFSMVAKSGRPMYAKEVDTSTLGGRATNYLIASAAEIKKIVWPTPRQVFKNTLVVLACVLVLGIVIWGLDWLWGFVFSLLFG